MQPRDMTIASDCTYLFCQKPETIEQNIGQYAPNKKAPLYKGIFQIIE